MKTILTSILAALLFSAPAFSANPRIVSDSVSRTDITHCAWYMDAVPRQLVLAPKDASGKPFCELAITGLSNGTHTVTAAFVIAGSPTNPEVEGPKSDPLNFTQPALPSKPSGLEIKP